jgi:hypothetical protein
MAIKGKGKTRSKTVARAPRREPVAVPTPVFQRRWVQVVGGVLLGMGIVVFIGWVRGELRSSSEEDLKAERLALRTAAIQAWSTELETQLGSVGTLQPPLEPTVAADVVTAITKLEQGKKATMTAEELETAAADLGTAADALDGFDLAGTLADQGFNAEQVDAIVTSRLEFVQAIRQYQRAAQLAALALATEDDELAAQLAGVAKETSDAAAELLSDGWRKYQLALSVAGLGTTAGLPVG